MPRSGYLREIFGMRRGAKTTSPKGQRGAHGGKAAGNVLMWKCADVKMEMRNSLIRNP